MNNYFTKRGNKTIVVEFEGEKLNIGVKIPTNREHNETMERYTEFGVTGIANVKISEMAEAQLISCVIELPFEVPVDDEMNTFKLWSECNNNEKKIAINCMDSKLHDAISNGIMSNDKLTESESGN